MGFSKIIGLGFPFGSGSNGVPGKATDIDVIKSSLKSLFGIGKNEVPMSNIGMNVNTIIFETITPIRKARIAKEYRSLVERFEPRATLLSINVTDKEVNGVVTLYVIVTFEALGQEHSVGMSSGVPMDSGG